jgi:hypothetical protein
LELLKLLRHDEFEELKVSDIAKLVQSKISSQKYEAMIGLYRARHR